MESPPRVPQPPFHLREALTGVAIDAKHPCFQVPYPSAAVRYCWSTMRFEEQFPRPHDSVEFYSLMPPHLQMAQLHNEWRKRLMQAGPQHSYQGEKEAAHHIYLASLRCMDESCPFVDGTLTKHPLDPNATPWPSYEEQVHWPPGRWKAFTRQNRALAVANAILQQRAAPTVSVPEGGTPGMPVALSRNHGAAGSVVEASVDDMPELAEDSDDEEPTGVPQWQEGDILGAPLPASCTSAEAPGPSTDHHWVALLGDGTRLTDKWHTATSAPVAVHYTHLTERGWCTTTGLSMYGAAYPHILAHGRQHWMHRLAALHRA